MGISVFGLGYVGCISAACFAREGFDVIGVDINPAKVDMMQNGRPTVVEEGTPELVAEMVSLGRLRATNDIEEAVRTTDVSLICVGTPSRLNGSIDLSHIERVSREIGRALREKSSRHTIVVRSTTLPGTIHSLIGPTLEDASAKRLGVDFAVCSNPEFLREGTSIRDFFDPPFTLIGADDPCDAEPLRSLYAGITAPLHITAIKVAETVKYACNSFHALKVGYANEIGNFCKALGVDSHEVMRLLCEDRKLNISPAYLRPGFAFGGSCLPKDVRAMVYKARQTDVETPILSAVLESNRRQIERAYRMVVAAGSRRIGVLGLAFKAGTDDLRESPLVALIEMLIGKGMQLAIYDRSVSESNIIGSNREYIEREVPHIWSLMNPELDDVLAHAEVVVIGNGAKEFRNLEPKLRPGQTIIDLVRAFTPDAASELAYDGICW